MDRHAFVAGATGLTGRFVVEYLINAGVAVTAHIRPDSSRIDHWTSYFRGLGADISTVAWDKDAMNRVLATLAPDYVFGLLGTTKKRARSGGGDYQAVDYGLTAILIHALSALERCRFIYLSAAGVTDDTRNAYYKARAQVEGLLRTSDFAHLIARPSFIVGNRDDSRPLEAVGAPILDGVLGFVSAFGARAWASRYRSMTGDELARGLVHAAMMDCQGILGVQDLKRHSVLFGQWISNRNQETEST